MARSQVAGRFVRSERALVNLLRTAKADVDGHERELAEAKERLAAAAADCHDEGGMSFRAIGAVLGWSHVGVMKLVNRASDDE